MGLFNFFKKKPILPQTADTAPQKNASQKMSHADKELVMVNQVTIEDMQKICTIPFVWNTSIKKFIQPHGHPFAYIDLIGPNVEIAKQELEKMNALIESSSKLSATITKRISIPVSKIVFTPQRDYGYTRLICTPHTYTGELSQYPASLSFMTDLSNNTVSTHGDLFYGQDGQIQKAEVFCWRTSGSHFYYFNTVDGTLMLERFEQNGQIVYKAPHILAREKARLQEEEDFAWLQDNLPDACPKSISGFRRMKTQNTKGYQTLKQFAAELGKDI